MELTLLEQITNAVRERVHPFRVEAREVGNTVDGKAIIVKVEGVRKEFGYRAVMADGAPNAHTPETFADALAYQAMKEISAILAADEKQDRKAAKRMAAG